MKMGIYINGKRLNLKYGNVVDMRELFSKTVVAAKPGDRVQAFFGEDTPAFEAVRKVPRYQVEQITTDYAADLAYPETRWATEGKLYKTLGGAKRFAAKIAKYDKTQIVPVYCYEDWD